MSWASEKTYDLIIIGAGPAGITASVYAARKKINFVVITGDVGGQAALAKDIDNYTGFQFIPSFELVEKFRQHLEEYAVEIKGEEKVNLVVKEDGQVKVLTDKGEYRAKTVVVASGRKPRKLGVEGEEKFSNKGLTYCATCDAPIFSGKDVAVVGGGNSGLDAVLQLIKIAHKVYLLDVADKLSADPIMVEKVENSDKVMIHKKVMIKQIYGDKFVRGIKFEQEGRMREFAVEGIFVEIGSLPSTDFIRDVEKNEAGEIIVNCRCETSLSGIFAAGDVTSVAAKQIIVACGEGCKATLAAFDYLNKTK